MVTFVQTERKTNFNKGGLIFIYLFLLTHFHGSCMLARLSPTYFTVGSCARVEEENGNSDGNQAEWKKNKERSGNLQPRRSR